VDSTGAFGVADGVGGSKTEGVDPGHFSRQLLKHCRDSFLQRSDGSSSPSLQTAVAAASAGLQESPIGGSSTLLLGQLDKGNGNGNGSDENGSGSGETGVVRFLNLGDSGAMLYRPASRRFKSGTFLWPRLVMKSHDQTHFFNCPYQVSSEDFDSAIREADLLETPARAGDIIVAASDGVLDNLFDVRIQMHIAQLLEELLSPSPLVAQSAVGRLAAAIADESATTGLRENDESLKTPFVLSAAEEGHRFVGGKLDDVAVVCGLVRSDKHDRPPEQEFSNF